MALGGPGGRGAQGDDVGERVEALLSELTRQGGPPAAATGDELVRILVGFYGAGLERVVEVVQESAPELMGRLVDDPLVESQLILHGLHPLTLEERIEGALDQVRPYLGSHAGGVAFLGVDDDGVAHLRLDGSCNGCPSSTVTVRLTIEEALLDAAPEIVRIDVDGQAREPEKLLQIGLRPGLESTVPVVDDAARWLHPAAPELPAAGACSIVSLDGRPVLMCRLGDTYYAYANVCPTCGGSFAGASLEGEVLRCPSCSGRYDVRLAGRAADGSGRRMEPLPLLDDVSGIRVALLPAMVP